MRLYLFVILLFVTVHSNARDINYAEFKACYFGNHEFVASLVNAHKRHLLSGRGVVWMSEPSLFSSQRRDWTLQGFYVWRELSGCTLDLISDDKTQVCKVDRAGSTYGQLPLGVSPVFLNELFAEGIDGTLFEQFLTQFVRALLDANGGVVDISGFGQFRMHPQTYKIVQRNVLLSSASFYNPQDTVEVFTGSCHVGTGTVHQNSLQNGYQLFFTPQVTIYESVPANVNVVLDSAQGFSGQNGGGLFDGANANESLTNRIFYWRYTASYVRVNLPIGGYLWRSGTATAINAIGRLKIQQIQEDDNLVDISERHLDVTPINHLSWERFTEWLEPGVYEFSGGGLNYRVDSEWDISSSPLDRAQKSVSNNTFNSVQYSVENTSSNKTTFTSPHCKIEMQD